MFNLPIFLKIVKVFVYIFSIPFCVIIIILSPFIVIRFGLLSSERIGELAMRTEIYLMNKMFKTRKTLNIDIFTHTHIIANKTLLDLIKKRLFTFPSIIGYPIYHLFKILSIKIHFFKKFIIKLPLKDYNHLFSKTESCLKLDTTWLKKGEEFLEKLKIKKNSKIICLIVRDTNYLQLKFPTKNWNYQNHRNCDLSNYEMAIKYAMDKGYYVFHMGDKPKNYLDLEDKKFIQYAKNYRTDFLDVYLAKRCEFCITNGTGWDILPAYSFKKPIVWTNVVPAGDPISFSHRYIFSIKLHYHKKKEKFLSLKEIHDMDLSFKFSSKDYTDSNVVLIENNPGEIKKMTEEMIDTLSNKIRYSSEDVENQKKLLKIYNECFSYKYGNHINSFSRMGQFFLNQNQFLIEKKLS